MAKKANAKEAPVAVIEHDDDRPRLPSLIKGDLIKFDNGKWRNRDGEELPELRLFVVESFRCLQRWEDQLVVGQFDERVEPLPDPDTLNEAIPKAQWEDGLNGEPRKPWQTYHAVVLFDPIDGSLYTSINCTAGQYYAYERLATKTSTMRRFRGQGAVPLVTLAARPMKTKFGTKSQPEFKILEWKILGNAAPALAAPAVQVIGQSVSEPSLREEMSDDLPF